MERTKQLMPWQITTMTPSQMQRMYRDWGVHFTKHQFTDIASTYYNKSLELVPNDPKALYYRSQCKRDIANPKSALKDAQMAVDQNQLFKSLDTLEVCDDLYALNEFENNKIALHEGLAMFAGSTIEQSFMNRLCVVDDDIKATLGDTLTTFIVKNMKLFEKVHDLHQRKINVDNRPLWKILQEQKKCDLLSIIEQEEQLISPRQIMKSKRSREIYIQTYINSSYEDVVIFQQLLKNQNLLLPISKKSTPFIREILDTKLKILNAFIKMLHSRSPLYTRERIQFPNSKVRLKHKEGQLFRIQEQTRRTMHMILRTTKNLRAKGNLKELIKYVEEVMSDYVSIKTYRTMPWKMEFVYEIYNILALTFVDTLKVPANIQKDLHLTELKRLVLRGPNVNTKANVSFTFGDKRTYQDLDSFDKTFYAYKKTLERLEKRMYFAVYDIEKCYLYHEIARTHLKQMRFDECCSVAKKGVQASEGYNLPIWAFLTNLLIVRAHSSLGKLQHERDALLRGKQLAKVLNNENLNKYIWFCLGLNSVSLLSKSSIDSATRKPSYDSRRSSIASRKSSVASSRKSSNTGSMRQSVSSYLEEKN